MATDVFAERLVRIRTRFAGNLPGKIDNLDLALPQISGEGETVVETLATIHRSDHEMCGTGPTVGFIATGQAARSIEKILIQPPAHKTRADCHRSRGRVRANRHPAR